MAHAVRHTEYAVAARTRPLVATARVGLVCALLGAALTVAASVTRLRLTDDSPLWPGLGNAASVLACLVALMQWLLWRLALVRWDGGRRYRIGSWQTLSMNGAWLSPVCAAITGVCALAMMQQTSPAETAWWFALVGAVLVVCGATLAGMHRFRPEGPAGIITPMPRLEHEFLTRRAADDVATTDLVERCTRADGHSPLNEQGRRMLAGHHHGRLLVATDHHGTPLGLAVVDPDDQSGQLLIDPEYRRQGIGTALVQQSAAQTWWSFGTLPGARGLAEHLGLRPVRELLRMERPLDAADCPTPQPRPDAHIDPFTTGDADALLALNAAAFADHPEQGAMDADDLADKQRQGWFEADDLLLAHDDQGRLLGFCWTKVEDGIGEVYVLGVDPAAGGRGLGRWLLEHGLAHLAGRTTTAELYVEAANTRVVQMYRRAGFTTANTDTLFGGGPVDAELAQ